MDSVDARYEVAKRRADEYNQGHIFTFWPTLTKIEQEKLLNDVEEIDFKLLDIYFQECCKPTVNVDELLRPLPAEVCGTFRDAEKRIQYEDAGLRLISQGKTCALLMAGGQGTRLGVKYPKGMYDVGLPSGKTLYQLQAERILRISQVARQKFGGEARVPWYIMTSEHTQDATQRFFEKHNYFGLKREDVIMFEQYTLPAVTEEGKVILETKSAVSKAPDGNGGLYRVLRERGILRDMRARGIEFVHVYGVDNILAKICDPAFFGFCTHKGAECGAKVVEKVQPTEAVGIIVVVGDAYQVVEYSEISQRTAEKREAGDSSRLLYHHGNICNHFFTVSFLERVSDTAMEHRLPHHVAKKKVPCVDLKSGETGLPAQINGIKMEKFVFDVFTFAKNFAVWEVGREREFSPLKNGPTATRDCPATSRADLLRHHATLLKEAEAQILGADEQDLLFTNVSVEISPLASYGGEDLENLRLHFPDISVTDSHASIVLERGEMVNGECEHGDQVANGGGVIVPRVVRSSIA